MTRTSTPYPDVLTADVEFGAMTMWFEGRDVVDALLVDLRLATGRNDDSFETTIRPRRRALFQRFGHLAFLCGTLTGKLQIERHGREDRIELQVFLDEDDALRWLAER